MAKSFLYRPEDLRHYIIQTFLKLGVPQADAESAAEILVTADLRGVDSHGIIRLHTYYGSRIRSGLVNPETPLTIVRESPNTLALDAGAGLGMVASRHAMQMCISKAREHGVGMVTVRNSNHYGIAGYYAMMALPEDMIGISFTNSQPLVAPTYGRKALLGTNPIAVAAPAMNERPFVLDMATSIVPIGRITVYDKASKELPSGWGIDQEGRVTTDPKAVLNGGALMALGGIDIMRGYKGYGLGMVVDIFSGLLSGSAFGPNVGHPGETRPADVGHFFMAARIDSFRPAEEFKRDMDQLIRQLKESPKAVDQERIYIAGEKEFEKYEKNLVNGIPLLEEVVAMLDRSGREIGLPFDLTPLGERVE